MFDRITQLSHDAFKGFPSGNPGGVSTGAAAMKEALAGGSKDEPAKKAEPTEDYKNLQRELDNERTKNTQLAHTIQSMNDGITSLGGFDRLKQVMGKVGDVDKFLAPPVLEMPTRPTGEEVTAEQWADYDRKQATYLSEVTKRASEEAVHRALRPRDKELARQRVSATLASNAAFQNEDGTPNTERISKFFEYASDPQPQLAPLVNSFLFDQGVVEAVDPKVLEGLGLLPKEDTPVNQQGKQAPHVSSFQNSAGAEAFPGLTQKQLSGWNRSQEDLTKDFRNALGKFDGFQARR